MQSYVDIFKQAYVITKKHWSFWVLGMFLIGTFNLKIFRFSSLVPKAHFSDFDFSGLMWYFQSHPRRLALLSFSVLVIALGSLFITNFSRVLLLLLGQSAADNKPLGFRQKFRDGLKLLWPVIQISLFTTVFMLSAVLVLVAPLMVGDLVFRVGLWVLGLAIFFPLVFTISSVNIFTGMFVVLCRLPVKKALNAGTDFFICNWTDLLGITAVLLVLYLAGFGLVEAVWLIVKFVSKISLLNLQGAGILRFSGVFIIIKALGALFFWFVLGALNAFVNIVLMLFFLSRIKIIKSEQLEDVKLTQPNPVSM